MRLLIALFLSASAALAVDVAGIGDSIMAGHCTSLSPQTFLTAIENSWVEAGDTNMSPPHVLRRVSGFTLTTTNLGHGSYTWSNLDASVKGYIPAGTKYVIAECGINDIFALVTWASALASLNSIKSYCDGLGAKFILNDIMPDAGASDAQSLTIRTWNTNYHAWAATNGAYTIQNHDSMGQLRVSTGYMDDFNTAYMCAVGADSVHLNTNGIAVWTTNMWTALYGIINFPQGNASTANIGTMRMAP